MTNDELRAQLRAILAVEEQTPTDWQKVESLCLTTKAQLATRKNIPNPPDIVHRFLDEPEDRRNERGYGPWQRRHLRQWLDSV
jgi:hypothetical protein